MRASLERVVRQAVALLTSRVHAVANLSSSNPPLSDGLVITEGEISQRERERERERDIQLGEVFELRFSFSI